MTKHRFLGIYMDHSSAHMMEIVPGGFENHKIDSAFNAEVRKEDIHEGETRMHNAENHDTATYYKHIGDYIRNFNEVVVFGPTHAKDELLNHLKADHRFANIKVEVKHSDKLTENQQHAFVKEHFSIKNV